jgi:hypothetical protein
MITEIEQLENGTVTDRVIEIKAVYKTTKHTVQPAYDPMTNWWAGVERLSDRDKEAREYYVTVGNKVDPHLNTKLVLKDGLILDLNTEVDKITWQWLKHCPEIAMSFEEAQSSKALFYVHIEGRESQIKNKKSMDIFKAMELVINDPRSNHVNRALLLGFDMEGENPDTVEEFLLEKAKTEPKTIERIYRDKSMKINLLYLKAKKARFIIEDPETRVIKYGTTILGLSDESAIAFLQQNEDILELLERDVDPDYYNSKKAIAKPTTEKKQTPIELAQEARKKKLEEGK